MDDFKVCLDDFREIVEHATERLQMIPEAQSGQSPARGKWSAKEVIGHLIDSAGNNHQRFVRAQFADDLVFPGYEQESWVQVQRYNSEPWLELVQLWRLFNLHLAHVMAGVPEDSRTKLRLRHNLNELAWQTVAETEPVTLEYFMRDYILHLQHHLRQITS